MHTSRQGNTAEVAACQLDAAAGCGPGWRHAGVCVCVCESAQEHEGTDLLPAAQRDGAIAPVPLPPAPCPALHTRSTPRVVAACIHHTWIHDVSRPLGWAKSRAPRSRSLTCRGSRGGKEKPQRGYTWMDGSTALHATGDAHGNDRPQSPGRHGHAACPAGSRRRRGRPRRGQQPCQQGEEGAPLFRMPAGA